MEIEVSSSSNFVDLENRKNEAEEDRERIRVKRETLKAVLEQCHRALQLLGNNTDGVDEVNDDHNDNDNDRGKPAVEDDDDKELSRENSVASPGAADREAYELCDLLKSRVGCPDFLEKLECDYMLVPQNLSEEGSSWDMVSGSDLWEDGIVDSDQEDYVLVRQEDLVEGIACFMAAYLLSFRQTNDLTPNQLQEALSKTFSVKKKKGKLRKAWDGSKVIYNVASWGATAIGIYQNPVILRAASKAFWTSCHVISKLL